MYVQEVFFQPKKISKNNSIYPYLFIVAIVAGVVVVVAITRDVITNYLLDVDILI